LQVARSLLAVARRDPGTLEQSLHYLCKRAFRDFQFAPSVILDYMVVSSPGLFEEAGFSEAEIDELMPTIDRVVGEEWVGRHADNETVVRIAREILDGSTSVFLGCKQLVGPLNRLGVHREEPWKLTPAKLKAFEKSLGTTLCDLLIRAHDGVRLDWCHALRGRPVGPDGRGGGIECRLRRRAMSALGWGVGGFGRSGCGRRGRGADAAKECECAVHALENDLANVPRVEPEFGGLAGQLGVGDPRWYDDGAAPCRLGVRGGGIRRFACPYGVGHAGAAK